MVRRKTVGVRVVSHAFEDGKDLSSRSMSTTNLSLFHLSVSAEEAFTKCKPKLRTGRKVSISAHATANKCAPDLITQNIPSFSSLENYSLCVETDSDCKEKHKNVAFEKNKDFPSPRRPVAPVCAQPTPRPPNTRQILALLASLRKPSALSSTSTPAVTAKKNCRRKLSSGGDGVENAEKGLLNLSLIDHEDDVFDQPAEQQALIDLFAQPSPEVYQFRKVENPKPSQDGSVTSPDFKTGSSEGVGSVRSPSATPSLFDHSQQLSPCRQPLHRIENQTCCRLTQTPGPAFQPASVRLRKSIGRLVRECFIPLTPLKPGTADWWSIVEEAVEDADNDIAIVYESMLPSSSNGAENDPTSSSCLDSWPDHGTAFSRQNGSSQLADNENSDSTHSGGHGVDRSLHSNAMDVHKMGRENGAVRLTRRRIKPSVESSRSSQCTSNSSYSLRSCRARRERIVVDVRSAGALVESDKSISRSAKCEMNNGAPSVGNCDFDNLNGPGSGIDGFSSSHCDSATSLADDDDDDLKPVVPSQCVSTRSMRNKIHQPQNDLTDHESWEKIIERRIHSDGSENPLAGAPDVCDAVTTRRMRSVRFFDGLDSRYFTTDSIECDFSMPVSVAEICSQDCEERTATSDLTAELDVVESCDSSLNSSTYSRCSSVLKIDDNHQIDGSHIDDMKGDFSMRSAGLSQIDDVTTEMMELSLPQSGDVSLSTSLEETSLYLLNSLAEYDKGGSNCDDDVRNFATTTNIIGDDLVLKSRDLTVDMSAAENSVDIDGSLNLEATENDAVDDVEVSSMHTSAVQPSETSNLLGVSTSLSDDVSLNLTSYLTRTRYQTRSTTKYIKNVHDKLLLMTSQSVASDVGGSSKLGDEPGLIGEGDHVIDNTGGSCDVDRLTSELQTSVVIDDRLHGCVDGEDIDLLYGNQFLKYASSHNAAEQALRLCRQDAPVHFGSYIADRFDCDSITKIGEGIAGEVFKARVREDFPELALRSEEIVFKIIPINGSALINGEKQKSFDEIVPELLITLELSLLSGQQDDGEQSDPKPYFCPTFVKVIDMSLLVGRYPEVLLKVWDRYDQLLAGGSENERPDETVIPRDQMFIVFEFENGGKPLEMFQVGSVERAESIVRQVVLALHVAEEKLQFEHRDLHWGNVLVKECGRDENIEYATSQTIFQISSCGVRVCIIDYTLSRLTLCRKTDFYQDLSREDGLFQGEGDYQFDVYRRMRDLLDNDWSRFEPKCNLYWIHYLVDKLLVGKSYKRRDGKLAKLRYNQAPSLRELHQKLLDETESTFDVIHRFSALFRQGCFMAVDH